MQSDKEKFDVSNLDREPRAEIAKKYENPPLHIVALYRPTWIVSFFQRNLLKEI
jgi:hypothetical protein